MHPRRPFPSLVLLLAALTLATPLIADREPVPKRRIFLVGGETTWLDTGLTVRPEDHLTVRAGSELCFSGGELDSCVRASGLERSVYESEWPEDAAACADPFPDWPHAALVAEVGGEPLLVGKELRIEGRDGELRLGINDCSTAGELGNEGEFSVVVAVADPAAWAAQLGRERIEQALEALGGDAIDDFRSLAVRAACTGPGGPFTTEVLSLRPDRTFFRQSSESGEIELVVRGEKAWRVDPESGLWKKQGKDVREFVRGHEFHLLFLELDRRFDRHTLPVGEDEPDEEPGGAAAAAGAPVEAEGAASPVAGAEPCVRVEMVDLQGAPAAVCIGEESGLPVWLEYQPGGRRKEPTLHLRPEGWREIDGVLYLEGFTLEHGEELFTYRYERIEPNAVDPALFRMPRKKKAEPESAEEPQAADEADPEPGPDAGTSPAEAPDDEDDGPPPA